MTTRPPTLSLNDRFVNLPPDLQRRLYRVVEVIGGMSHEEKVEARVEITGLLHYSATSPHVFDALASLDGLIFGVDRLATPLDDAGDPRGDLAHRFLAKFAEDHNLNDQEG